MKYWFISRISPSINLGKLRTVSHPASLAIDTLSDVIESATPFGGLASEISHLPFVVWLTTRLAPQWVVELGAGDLTTYFAICQSLRDQNAPGHCLSLLEPGHLNEAVLAFNAEHYAGFSELLSDADPTLNIADGALDLLVMHLSPDVEEIDKLRWWTRKLSARGVVLLLGPEALSLDGQERLNAFKAHLPCIELAQGMPRVSCILWGAKQVPILREIATYEQDTGSPHPIKGFFAHLREAPLIRAERDQLAGQYAEQRQSLAQAQAALEHLQAEFDQQKAAWEQERVTLTQAVTELENTLSAVTNSTSWKLTAPMRQVIGAVKKP